MTEPLSTTPRTTLKRRAQRAQTDRTALYALLDECPIVHVATPGPRLLPMAFGRVDDRLYLHGAQGNGLLAAALGPGREVCVCATRLDGLVLARSAFHHSMNYRCAVVYGALVEVEGDEKRAALAAITDHTLPGRSGECRPPSDAELRTTRVVALSLAEASVKVRAAPPVDLEADLALPHWAGVLPLEERALPPVADGEGDPPPPPSLEAAALARAPRLSGGTIHRDWVVTGDPRRLDLGVLLAWLRDDSYWATDLTPARLLRSIQGSFVASAHDADGRQVAFARAVTDGETFGWLADVYVAREARGHGLGRAITGFLVDHADFAGMRRWMLGTVDAHGLYERFGFEPLPPGRFLQKRSPTAGC